LAPATWYDDLTAQLIRVDDADIFTQNSDGSWGPTSEPIFGGEPYEFATVQALLALETRSTVLRGWMRVTLGTEADLHVYDPEGRHVGLNYETGQVEIEIPRAWYSGAGVDPQIVVLPDVPGGKYRIVAVGTASEWYTLSVDSFIGDRLVGSETTRGEISAGAANEYSVIVASVVGPQQMFTDLPPLPAGIGAVVDLDPDTLNLKSQGKWVTCCVELPAGYDVSRIDLDTIKISGVDYRSTDKSIDVVLDLPCDRQGPTEIGDYDSDGVPDLMVKFDRGALVGTLDVADEAVFFVEGYVEATPFVGADTIRVIKPSSERETVASGRRERGEDGTGGGGAEVAGSGALDAGSEGAGVASGRRERNSDGGNELPYVITEANIERPLSEILNDAELQSLIEPTSSGTCALDPAIGPSPVYDMTELPYGFPYSPELPPPGSAIEVTNQTAQKERANGCNTVAAGRRGRGGVASSVLCIGDEDNGTNVVVRIGGHLKIALRGSGSTGYAWEVKEFSAAVLEQIGDVGYQEDPQPFPEHAMYGIGGVYVAEFRASGSGKTLLKLVYRRPWEEGVAPKKVFEVTVSVE